MNRRNALIAIASTPLASGCFYERWFDLEWDEEVLLHDGQLIVVHLKQSYERLSQGFSRYSGTSVTRDTTLTIDAGNGIGSVTQIFKGFHPMLIERSASHWYGVLYGGYYNRSRELPGHDWGELEGPYGQWAIQLVAGKWIPISMTRLPSVFQTPNVLMLYGTAEEHAKFHGRRVTLQEKSTWLALHPLGYADVRLTRPNASSPRRVDAISSSSKE